MRGEAEGEGWWGGVGGAFLLGVSLVFRCWSFVVCVLLLVFRCWSFVVCVLAFVVCLSLGLSLLDLYVLQSFAVFLWLFRRWSILVFRVGFFDISVYLSLLEAESLFPEQKI